MPNVTMVMGITINYNVIKFFQAHKNKQLMRHSVLSFYMSQVYKMSSHVLIIVRCTPLAKKISVILFCFFFFTLSTLLISCTTSNTATIIYQLKLTNLLYVTLTTNL